tara:strand:- start:1274 stop:1516 length:243 start_codon:yes stop_codon:yes gene_type:complete
MARRKSKKSKSTDQLRRERLESTGLLGEKLGSSELRTQVIEEAGFTERDFSGDTPRWAYGVGLFFIGLSAVVGRHLARKT